MLCFLSSLVFLFLSGGVLPPVLLPKTLQKMMFLSPVTWLRSTLALCAGEYDIHWGHIVSAAVAALAMVVLGGVLHHRRSQTGEADL